MIDLAPESGPLSYVLLTPSYRGASHLRLSLEKSVHMMEFALYVLTTAPEDSSSYKMVEHVIEAPSQFSNESTWLEVLT